MTNSLSTKKIVAFAAGLAIAFSGVFVSSASAQTAEELQAQIASLLAMIANLQAQLGNTGDSTTPAPTTGGTCTAMQFTLTHKIGDRGGEVMNIQKFLNANGFTVATAGPGSMGQETSYFGPATKAAVIAFQNAYAAEVLAPVGLSTGTGYWGSSSRAKANAMEIARCAAAPTPAPTPAPEDEEEEEEEQVTNDLTVSAAAQPGNSLAPKGASQIPFTKFTLTAGSEDVTVENITVELTGLASREAFDKVMLLDEDGLIVGREESLDSDDQADLGNDFVIKAGESKTFTVAATRVSTSGYDGEVAAFSVVAINTDVTVEGSLPITGAQHTINGTLSIGSVTLSTSSPDTAVEMGEEDVELATLGITANGEDILLKKVRFYQDGNADLKDALDDLKAMYNGKSVDVEIDGDYIVVDFGSGVVLEEGDSEDLELTATIVGGAGDKIQIDIDEAADFIAVGNDYGYGVEGTKLSWPEITIGAGTVTIKKNADFDNNEKVAAGTDKALLSEFEVEAEGEDVTGDLVVTIKIDGKSASTSDADIDLDNLAIYKGSTRISSKEDTLFATTTPGATTTVTFDDVTFERSTDFVEYSIKGDINKDVADGTIYEIESISYQSVETESGENINDSIDENLNHKIEIEGAVVTVEISSPSPAEASADKDAQLVAEIQIDAEDSGDDITVTQIKMEYLGASTTVAKVTNCELFDGTNSVSDREDAGTAMNFSGLNIEVAAGESKDLTMKCDISNDFPTGSTSTISFGTVKFDAEGDVTGTDFNNKSATGTSTVTVKSGIITALVTSDDENDDKAVMENTNGVVLAIIEVEADDADVTLDTATVTLATSTVIDGKVKLYVNGNLEEDADASSTMAFNNLNIDIDNGEKINLVFKADVINAVGSTATTTGITNVDLAVENGATTTVATSTQDFATITVSEAIPTITQIDVDTANLETANDVTLFAFSVTATGDDITIGTTTATTKLNGATTSNAYWYVYDNADMTGSEEAKVAFTSGQAAGLNVAVSEGDTYYVFIVADVDTIADSRSIRVQMDDLDGSITFTPDIGASLLLEDDMKSLLKKD